MLQDLTRKVAVVSRSKGSVSYSIPTLRVARTWLKAGDSLDIPIDELLELRVMAGGAKLMDKYLMIADKEAYSIVYNEDEMIPEYEYGIDEVKYLYRPVFILSFYLDSKLSSGQINFKVNHITNLLLHLMCVLLLFNFLIK